MNRRRQLNRIHARIARQDASALPPVIDHSTIGRLSIADLDRIGPRLVTTAPREVAACFYCAETYTDREHYPYCSTQCAINAEHS